MKQIFGRSNGVSAAPAWACAFFSSGIASPVSVDWLTKRSFAEVNLNVRWDHVAGRQQHNIAGHQLLDRDFVMLFRCARSLPAHGRGDPYHPSQRVGSLARTMFLDETQRDAQPHHDRNHDGDPLIA